jgi:hypothetical protein
MSTRRLFPLELLRLAVPALAFAAAAPALAGPAQSPFVQLPWPNAHGATSLARYGSVVAPAGDVNGDGFSDVLVAAPHEEGPAADAGRVYLFLGSANGLAAAAAWSWSANQAQGATGTSVAAAGDVNGDGFADVVVGTPGWTVGGSANAGKISVFHGGPTPTGLPPNPSYERTAPTPTAQARFGASVGTAGNVNGDPYDDLVVGAPLHTSGGLTGRGAAFVFHGGNAGLAAAPALTLLGAQAGAHMGQAVSTAGDVDADGFSDVIVGAPFALFQGEPTGTAGLYRGAAGGLLAVADTLLGGTNILEELGAAVANAGDVDGDGYADVLVGSPGWGDGDLHMGRYAVLRGGPGGLQSNPLLRKDGQNVGDRLGAAVATVGDLDADGYADFAVGMPADSAGGPGGGRVRVHLGGPAEITNYDIFFEILSSAPQAQYFGTSVATAGDVDADGFSEFLVGDPTDSFLEGMMEGTATLLERSRSEPAISPTGPVEGQPDERRGTAVAIAPGMDGSGRPRVVVGSPGYPIGTPNWGITYLFSGIEFGIAGYVMGETSGEQLGSRLADVGDVNKDGWTDLLISSPTYTGAGGSEAGRVYLWKGKTNPPLDPPVVLLEGDQPFARAGSAIAGRGDVNGDGYADLVIGARDWDGPGLPDCGKVWVLFGAAGGTGPGQWTVTGSVAGQGLGASVALGDLDGDAWADVIIGSVSPLAVDPPAGKVQVHYGGIGGPSATATWAVNSRVPSPSFGTGLAVGDVLGDPLADLIVGAPHEGSSGRIYVFRGESGRGRPAAAWSRGGAQVGAQYGAAIAAGGDVDGDGKGDFVVGEPKSDPGITDAGRAHLYHGHPFEPVPGWTYAGNGTSMEFGASIAPFNDVNLDGFADIAIGAPQPVAGASGRVYLFMGGGRVGVQRGASVLKDVSSAPYLWRPARIASDFEPRVAYTLRSAEGRGRVKGEVEVVTQNQAFTGVATDATATFDTGPASPGFGSALGMVHGPVLPWMGIAYRFRARSRSTSPFFPGSRWMRPETGESGDFDVLRGGTEVAVEPGPGSWTGGAAIRGIAPNPFGTRHGAEEARIRYGLPRSTRVVLDLYDVRGARVRRLVDEIRPAGPSSASWDGRDDLGRAAPAGIYFAQLRADGTTGRARLVRLP